MGAPSADDETRQRDILPPVAVQRSEDDPAGARLSAAVFLKNLEIYRELLGNDAVRSALESLDETDRMTVDCAVPAAWLPAPLIDEVYTRIAAQAGRDVESLYREVVREGVKRTLKTVWRMLLRLINDNSLISRTPSIYGRGHDTGSVTADIPEPGRAEIVLVGWPDIPHLRMVGVAEGIGAVLEIAGRRDVVMTFTRTEVGANFHATWKV